MSGLMYKGTPASHGNVVMQGASTHNDSSKTSNVFQIDNEKGRVSQMSIDPNRILDAHNIINLFPHFYSKLTTVLPSYPKSQEVPQSIDTRLLQDVTKPNSRLTSYEQLTGVSTVRPEILLATTFQPIFRENYKHALTHVTDRQDSFIHGLNEYGEYIDVQLQLGQLKLETIQKLIREAKDNEQLKATLENQESQFRSHIDNLRHYADYLYSTLVRLNQLKTTLNLKSDNFKIDFRQIIYDHYKNASETLIDSIEQRIESNFTYPQLLTQLGFTQDNVENFTNTKIFLQSCYELKNLLQGYSNNLLGVSTLEQRNDTNPTYLNKHVHVTDQFLSDLKNIDIGSYDFLVDYNLENIDQKSVQYFANIVDRNGFQLLLKNIHFPTDENKIAFFAQMISKEYNYSVALFQPQFSQFIQSQYGYQTSDQFGNEGMFDTAIGFLGEKITDNVNNFSNNSLTTVSQQIDNNVGVLTFENDYIDYENGTYTPGSVYYVDSILELKNGTYDFRNTTSLLSILEAHIQRLTELSRHLNFFPQIKGKFSLTQTQFDETIGDAIALFDNTIYKFIDKTNNLPKKEIQNSPIAAAFAHAQTDTYLKSLAFVYVVSRTIAVTNPKAVHVSELLIQEIVDRINSRLKYETKPVNQLDQQKTEVPGKKSYVSSIIGHKEESLDFKKSIAVDELPYSMKSVNSFLDSFFSHFSLIFNTFVYKGTINNHFTRYSHIQDTTLMMVIFEFILSSANRYINQKFTGKFTSRSPGTIAKDFYSISVSNSGNTLSINSVHEKLNFEHDMLLKLFFGTLSSLKTLVNSIKSVTNSLQTKDSLKQLEVVKSYLGDNTLLSTLMSEQQIYLVKSLMEDITEKLQGTKTYVRESGELSSVEIETSEKDDVKILDDSTISEEMKNAFFAFFGNDKFTSTQSESYKILSVGIPHGFGKLLKERVKVSKVSADSYNSKQTDVIRVNVYKTDVEYQDLVFKPQSFLFELSRYVHRNEFTIKPVSVYADINQVLNSIPTRDYSFVSNMLDSESSYLDDYPAFTSPEYSFLSDRDKYDLIHNHVASYLYELYVRLLTGNQLSEYDFLVARDHISLANVDKPILDSLMDTRLNNIFQTTVKTKDIPTLEIFQTQQLTMVSKKKHNGDGVTFKKKVASGKYKSVQQSVNMVHDLKMMNTVYSSIDNQSKKIFTPKTFERIFNICVDPNEFEIDIEETTKTPAGKEAIDKLHKQNSITPDTHQTQFRGSPTAYGQDKLKLQPRHKSEGHLTFEKYFVTVESALETVE